MTTWYIVRREDGFVWYASGHLVRSASLAACISDNPRLWHAKVVTQQPRHFVPMPLDITCPR